MKDNINFRKSNSLRKISQTTTNYSIPPRNLMTLLGKYYTTGNQYNQYILSAKDLSERITHSLKKELEKLGYKVDISDCTDSKYIIDYTT